MFSQLGLRVSCYVPATAKFHGSSWGGSYFEVCNIIIKIHSSCEIEHFVETHICKLLRYSDRAYYWVCVLIKDICRRLPLELQCSLYQGQQGDLNQSVRGNYQTRF